MKLSISTLTCPQWTLRQIIDQCAEAGIYGIDFRGLGSEIDITHLPLFATDLPETLRLLNEKKLRLPCLNLSVTLMTPDADRWSSFLDETRRYARLARQTQTRYLRVFGGRVPKELTRDAAIDLARRHIRQLCKICSSDDCQILIETHDDWTVSDELLPLLDGFSPTDVGVLWDIEHPFRKGEAPERTAQRLSTYIRHTHIKDSSRVDSRNMPRLMGEGDLPIEPCLSALRGIGYTGWYSLEVEKRWRAEAPEPEQSIPQFAEYMRARLN